MTDSSSLYEKHAADVFRFALYPSGNQVGKGVRNV